MASYADHIKKALWHSKKCVKCIRKAAAALDVDLDKEPQSGGLVPPPRENDEAGSDWLDPVLPGGAVEDNPQRSRGRYLRLIG
jgi:hypothetical protein